jgi:hypothetical protein
MTTTRVRCHGCHTYFTHNGLFQHVSKSSDPLCRADYITSQTPSAASPSIPHAVSPSIPHAASSLALAPIDASWGAGDDTIDNVKCASDQADVVDVDMSPLTLGPNDISWGDVTLDDPSDVGNADAIHSSWGSGYDPVDDPGDVADADNSEIDALWGSGYDPADDPGDVANADEIDVSWGTGYDPADDTANVMDADAIDASCSLGYDPADDPADVADADAFDALSRDHNTTPSHSIVTDIPDDPELDSIQIDAEILEATTVVIDQFTSGSPGAPIPGISQSTSASLVTPGDSVWAPFQSQRDWEIAHWAKMNGPTASAVTELLAIPGVRAQPYLSIMSLNRRS